MTDFRFRDALAYGKAQGANLVRGDWGTHPHELRWSDSESLCHELAHWLVATPWERKQPWMALGDALSGGANAIVGLERAQNIEGAVGAVTFKLLLDFGEVAQNACNSMYTHTDLDKADLRILKRRGWLTSKIERDIYLANTFPKIGVFYNQWPKHELTGQQRVLYQLLEAR